MACSKPQEPQELQRRKHSKFLKERSESTSSDVKAVTVKQTTHSSKQVPSVKVLKSNRM
mgnify:FL=1